MSTEIKQSKIEEILRQPPVYEVGSALHLTGKSACHCLKHFKRWSAPKPFVHEIEKKLELNLVGYKLVTGQLMFESQNSLDTVNNMDSRDRLPGLKSQLCYLVVM